jgi:hypothetical protein
MTAEMIVGNDLGTTYFRQVVSSAITDLRLALESGTPMWLHELGEPQRPHRTAASTVVDRDAGTTCRNSVLES